MQTQADRQSDNWVLAANLFSVNIFTLDFLFFCNKSYIYMWKNQKKHDLLLYDSYILKFAALFSALKSRVISEIFYS